MFTSLVLTKALYEIGTIIQINLLVRKIRKRKVKCVIYGNIANKLKTKGIIYKPKVFYSMETQKYICS